MPVYPDRICLWCERSFPREEGQYGNQPAYCSLKCKKASRTHLHTTGQSKCGRCRQFYTKTYFSQRTCPQCRGPGKCTVCGKPVPDTIEPKTRYSKKYREGQELKKPRRHIYCSRICQEKAWEKNPLPVCILCKKEVTLPTHVFRNPPKVHYQCQIEDEHRKETLSPAEYMRIKAQKEGSYKMQETAELDALRKWMQQRQDLVKMFRDLPIGEPMKPQYLYGLMGGSEEAKKALAFMLDNKIVRLDRGKKGKAWWYRPEPLFHQLTRPAPKGQEEYD